MANLALAFATPLAFAFALTFGAIATGSDRPADQCLSGGVSPLLIHEAAWAGICSAASDPSDLGVLLDASRDQAAGDWVTSASLGEVEVAVAGGKSPTLWCRLQSKADLLW